MSLPILRLAFRRSPLPQLRHRHAEMYLFARDKGAGLRIVAVGFEAHGPVLRVRETGSVNPTQRVMHYVLNR